ncbi:MAG: hypothetical protein KDJ99_06510 [Candidatus Competibacteraceae bacterium]|nr:hypothetical protein [Candidatus Competibacteraceae bacterium]
MNRISGHDRSTNVSSDASTKRSESADAQTDRDVSTEGQHFSDLLHKKKSEEQQSTDTDTPDRAERPALFPSPAGTERQNQAQSSKLGAAIGHNTDAIDNLAQHADGETKALGATPDPTNSSAKEQQMASHPAHKLKADTIDRSSSVSSASNDDKAKLPDTVPDPAVGGQTPVSAAQLAALQSDIRQAGSDQVHNVGTTNRLTAAPKHTGLSQPSGGSTVTTDSDLATSPDLAQPETEHRAPTTNSPVSNNPLSAPDNHTKQDTTHKDKNSDATASSPGAAGDQILQGMLSQTVVSDQAVSKQSAATGDHIAELANRLAERVLVSDRSVSTDSTVHIQLRDSVLAGSEITLNRDQGQLVVSFNVSDAAVGQQLHSHTDDLQRQLSDKIKEPVSIQVNVGSNTADSGGDGRSRNQRDLNAEWQSNE